MGESGAMGGWSLNETRHESGSLAIHDG